MAQTLNGNSTRRSLAVPENRIERLRWRQDYWGKQIAQAMEDHPLDQEHNGGIVSGYALKFCEAYDCIVVHVFGKNRETLNIYAPP